MKRKSKTENMKRSGSAEKMNREEIRESEQSENHSEFDWLRGNERIQISDIVCFNCGHTVLKHNAPKPYKIKLDKKMVCQHCGKELSKTNVITFCKGLY